MASLCTYMEQEMQFFVLKFGWMALALLHEKIDYFEAFDTYGHGGIITQCQMCLKFAWICGEWTRSQCIIKTGKSSKQHDGHI